MKRQQTPFEKEVARRYYELVAQAEKKKKVKLVKAKK